MNGAFLAIEFLTVLRLRRPGAAAFDRAAFAAAQAYYPLVGLAIGGLTVLAWLGLDRALPAPAATALTVGVLVLLTGALHLDGLADSADGLLGGRDAESRLAIMRDPRTGSFGSAAITGVLLLKWAALLSIVGDGAMVAALVAAPAFARGALVFATARFPYARPDGMGAGFREAANGNAGRAAVIGTLIIGAALYGPAGAMLAFATMIAAVFVARWPYTRLGGLTGDIYGALVEVAETAVLLVAASGAEHGWLTPLLWEG